MITVIIQKFKACNFEKKSTQNNLLESATEWVFGIDEIFLYSKTRWKNLIYVTVIN